MDGGLALITSNGSHCDNTLPKKKKKKCVFIHILDFYIHIMIMILIKICPDKIYFFDSHLFWHIQLMIIKG
jgi:hypothetical protein